ncbi:MAG: hypothetical protein K2Y20_09575 [Sphingomonas sp.]|nr:hypothetical protein [Sphingomonas sp.]
MYRCADRAHAKSIEVNRPVVVAKIMVGVASNDSSYISITPQRRVVAAIFVALLYLVAVLILICQRDNAPTSALPDPPIVFTLLSPPKPPEPVVVLKQKLKPAVIPARGRRKAPPVRVDARLRLKVPSPASAPAPASVAPEPLPPAPDVMPLPNAPPVSIPSAGGGNRIGNGIGGIGAGGTGAGGTGAGGTGAGGNDSGGGGGTIPLPPRWLHRPTNEELLPLLPQSLRRVAFTANFLMRCKVALNTRLKCRVLKEVPYRHGLRRAVIDAVPLLRIAPATLAGRPIDGQEVEFWWRITFAEPPPAVP